ncbi:MAG TPA: DUF4349 domain-containing protein [Actinomycetota bacterium]|nr:DUF4349 domain-containing protein [Actinomycetota bacterium]
MRRVLVLTVGFLAAAGAVGYAVTSHSGQGGGGRAPMASASPVSGSGHAPTAAGQGDLTLRGAPSAASVEVSALGELPPIGPDIVKTARISIQVKKGGFQGAFDAASTIAATFGGYVQDSTMAGTRTKSGTLTIRVPSASFDEVMSDLRGIGTVQRQSISGRDVTSEFVDLQARLRTWTAQEAVLLKLMRQAASVEATLRVQNQLQDVQFRIEQIKGQLRVVQNQTSLATIQVDIREVGAPVRVEPAGVKRPSIAEAWNRALAGFLAVIYAMVVGLGYVVPVTLAGVGVWLGYRRIRPRPAVS